MGVRVLFMHVCAIKVCGKVVELEWVDFGLWDEGIYHRRALKS